LRSGRAIHQAARAELEARWLRDWCSRAPYRWLHARFVQAVEELAGWPAPEVYDELARRVPRADAELPRFVAQDRKALRQAGGYEQYVAQAHAVPTRERSWHDFFNMAVWAHFPRVRWALNAVHVDASLGPVDPRNGRAPEQNVASQLDESGIIIASSNGELLNELRELRFKRVFWERRAELAATTRFWIVGHGTLESLLTPHLGLASKAVLLDLPNAPGSYDPDELRCAVDRRVAELIAAWPGRAPVLDPIPLLGIPDYADNAAAEFYDDARYFRFQRRSCVP
jgi:hypothetical protein